MKGRAEDDGCAREREAVDIDAVQGRRRGVCMRRERRDEADHRPPACGVQARFGDDAGTTAIARSQATRRVTRRLARPEQWRAGMGAEREAREDLRMQTTNDFGGVEEDGPAGAGGAIEGGWLVTKRSNGSRRASNQRMKMPAFVYLTTLIPVPWMIPISLVYCMPSGTCPSR